MKGKVRECSWYYQDRVFSIYLAIYIFQSVVNTSIHLLLTNFCETSYNKYFDVSCFFSDEYTKTPMTEICKVKCELTSPSTTK